MKKIISFVLLVLFSGLAVASVNAQSGRSDIVPEQYIIVFKNSVTNTDNITDELRSRHGFEAEMRYSRAIKGFSARLSEDKLEALKNDPRVEFISEDHYVSIDQARETRQEARAESNARSNARGGGAIIIQSQTTPTGISRIFAESTTNKGAGVGVAVIDTGIDLTHPDLKTNIASQNKSCIFGKKNANDDNGHGTHVAGTIAALDNGSGVVGVAPQAKLFAVKVLNKSGGGTWSSVICGIDWVTANAATLGIKVANMSLGGGGLSDNNCGNSNNDALHKAICRARDAGVTFVVAAGNSGANASSFVPAAYDDAVITVSALADSNGIAGGGGPATSYGPDDTFATFSNFGFVVDIGAPGVSIYSTWKSGGFATISGTSMATPHVAGAAALFIKSHPGSTWSAIRDGLMAAGEALGVGHTDPSGLHPEKVLQASSL